MRKIGFIYLKGGFGNQLFQFTFAKYLEDLGLKIYVDTSNFSKSILSRDPNIELRELVLEPKYFDFNKLNKFSSSMLMNFIEIPKNPLLLKLYDTNLELNNLKKYNFFDGYWQDPKMVLQYKDFLNHSISKNNLISLERNAARKSGDTIVHVRRRDYLNLNEDLKLSFFKEAIDTASKKIEKFSYSVFTDDYEWVSKQSIFLGADKIYSSSNSIDNTLSDFGKMLSFNHFIVGNSTFSLMAALLNTNRDKFIIIADPWFRNVNKDIDIPNVIKIKNTL